MNGAQMSEEQTTLTENSEQEPSVEATPDIEELVRKQVEEQVAGLKATNQSLKEEKKKFQERAKVLDQLGGEDELKTLLEMKTRIEEDEESKLFLSGEREKYNERIIGRVREDSDAKVNALQGALEAAETEKSKWADRYHSQQVSLAISQAAEMSGVNPRLRKAVEGQIKDQIFFDTERDDIFIRDQADPSSIRYGKDGKPMVVSELIEMLREEQPELFLQSTGANAAGSNSGLTGRIPRDKIGSMSVAEYAKARKEGRL